MELVFEAPEGVWVVKAPKKIHRGGAEDAENLSCGNVLFGAQENWTFRQATVKLASMNPAPYNVNRVDRKAVFVFDAGRAIYETHRRRGQALGYADMEPDR